MYNKPYYHETSISLDNTKTGETIENKVKRLIQNKEPIKDGAPLIFTEKSAGVNAAYNIRTDRWEIATEAMDRLTKSKRAKRDEVSKTGEQKETKSEEGKVINGNFGKPEPTHGKATEN